MPRVLPLSQLNSLPFPAPDHGVELGLGIVRIRDGAVHPDEVGVDRSPVGGTMVRQESLVVQLRVGLVGGQVLGPAAVGEPVDDVQIGVSGAEAAVLGHVVKEVPERAAGDGVPAGKLRILLEPVAPGRHPPPSST